MKFITLFVKRHPLVTFFALSFMLTWRFLPVESVRFFPAGVCFAALIVASMGHGLAGLRELGTRMLRWRVGWRWYVIAIGLPLLVQLSAVTLNMALGAPAPSLTRVGPWYSVVLAFALRLINPADGPVAEEPGWRAFALPRLQAGRSPLVASLILALLVTTWHIPLLFLEEGGLQPAVVINLIVGNSAAMFWYTWLFNRTRGSGFMTLVAHAAQGSIQTSAF
jgi:membrane protease YdiL (CAAX protease family)